MRTALATVVLPSLLCKATKALNFLLLGKPSAASRLLDSDELASMRVALLEQDGATREQLTSVIKEDGEATRKQLATDVKRQGEATREQLASAVKEEGAATRKQLVAVAEATATVAEAATASKARDDVLLEHVKQLAEATTAGKEQLAEAIERMARLEQAMLAGQAAAAQSARCAVWGRGRGNACWLAACLACTQLCMARLPIALRCPCPPYPPTACSSSWRRPHRPLAGRTWRSNPPSSERMGGGAGVGLQGLQPSAWWRLAERKCVPPTCRPFFYRLLPLSPRLPPGTST